ncbi:MAG: DUF3313 family protein [Longimicrobiales bacterium]
MAPRRHIIPALVAFGTLAGCASSGPAPLPTVATGENADVSIDGLVRMDNSVFTLGYSKPDLDLSPYTAFIIDPVSVAYQKDPRGRTRNSPDANFELSARQMETLKEVFHEEIVEALGEDDGYQLVEEPAANALRLTAYLIDLVVRFPTERGGRTDTFVSSYGEVTLIVEARDSQSGEILARIGERGDPTSTTRDLAEVNSTFVRSDLTRMFGHWAQTMRERLDQLREVASM